jgi:hypothetical protein
LRYYRKYNLKLKITPPQNSRKCNKNQNPLYNFHTHSVIPKIISESNPTINLPLHSAIP